MNETLHERLTEEMQRVAAGAEVPPAPVIDLVRAGRRRQQRRRTITGLAGTAGVLFVVLGIAAGPPVLSSTEPVQPVQPGPSPTRPSPIQVSAVEDLPDGAAPRIPYWHDGVLHVGAATINTPLRQIVTAGGTTLVGASSVTGGSEWWLVDGEGLVPVVQGRDVRVPKVSPDGSLVVWEAIQPEVTTVSAWDVATRQVLATHEVTITQGCCDGPSLLLYGVNSHDQVFFGGTMVTDDGLTVWNPRTDTVRTVTGLGDLPRWPSRITAFGAVFQGDGASMFDTPGIYGTVDDTGAFHRVGTVPGDQVGTWSPDGTMLAYPGDDSGTYVPKTPGTTMVVLDLATGDTQTLGLPPGATGEVTWESPNTVLIHVVTGPHDHYLVRCDTNTRACRMALRVGSLQGWSLPMTY